MSGGQQELCREHLLQTCWLHASLSSHFSAGNYVGPPQARPTRGEKVKGSWVRWIPNSRFISTENFSFTVPTHRSMFWGKHFSLSYYKWWNIFHNPISRTYSLCYLCFLEAAKQEKMPVKPLAPEVNRMPCNCYHLPGSSAAGGPVSGSRAKAHPTGWDGGPPELAGAHIDFRALHGIRAGKGRPEILWNMIKLVWFRASMLCDTCLSVTLRLLHYCLGIHLHPRMCHGAKRPQSGWAPGGRGGTGFLHPLFGCA